MAKGKKGKAAAAAALAAKKKLKSAQANLKEITIESASVEICGVFFKINCIKSIGFLNFDH